jgi:thymidylate synthase (FAD)
MKQNVSLVGVTRPFIPGCISAEQLVAYCARVSNPKNQDNHDTANKLLKYCIKNNHWSIFEMVNVVMEIRTTRDIARQIIRHRSFSHQEFSQRYAEVDLTDVEYRETRLQDQKNRQNSVVTDDKDVIDKWNDIQDEVLNLVDILYRDALNLGIAKEQARALLPEGLTPSVMYMNGTLRSWIHYCSIRIGNGTQKEHQEIAKMCWDILCREFEFLNDPSIHEVLGIDTKVD